MNISAVTLHYDHYASLHIGALTLIIFRRKPFHDVPHRFLAYILDEVNEVRGRYVGDDPDFTISPLYLTQHRSV